MGAVFSSTKAIVLILAVALAGCQSSSGGMNWSGNEAGDGGHYTLASFNRLVSDGKFIEASELYNRDTTPFYRDFKSNRPSLKQVAKGVKAAFTPKLRSAEQALAQVDWPAPKEQWPSVGDALAQAKSVLADYKSHKVLVLAKKDFPPADDLTQRIQGLEYALYMGAEAAYAAYDEKSGRGFFVDYPADFDIDDRRRIEVGEWGNYLATVATTGKASWMPDDKRKEFSEVRYKERLAAAKAAGLDDFAATLRAIDEMRKDGFGIADYVDARIRLIDITSEALLEANHIDFTVGVNPSGLALDAEAGSLDEALSGPLAEDLDIVVIYGVSQAKANRRITRSDKVSSEYEAQKMQEPNPAFELAKFELEQALREERIRKLENSLYSSSGYGGSDAAALGGLLGGAIVGLFGGKSKIDKAKEKLASTPPYIYRSIYDQYELTKTTVTSRKQAQGIYYIVDRRTDSYVRDTLDIRAESSFTVVKGLHPKDRYKFRHRSGTVTDDDIAAFEESPAQVELTKLLEDVVAGKAKPKPTGGRTALLQTIGEEKRQVAAAYRAQGRRPSADLYDAQPINDDRIESVVYVLNPGISRGTGFFIREDLVLTNQHVIEGSRFVEVITHGGQESFGKVIAADERLDLALVKIAGRGKPAKLFRGRTLPLGEEVLAIGHPLGLDFTFTRGILSSVRTMESLSKPDAEKVRFVQTDAAINSGNSGGPLFLDEWVIGVNTWSYNADVADNLAFAVHYAEVRNFLARHGVTD